jgi:hypothetical protein
VNVGWDIKTGFPRDQVMARFYANVDSRLRELWKHLREIAESHGFGRIELLPLKYSGAACARYFTKYLTKAVGSEKCLGEERCRLFGVWGGVRFVYPRFTFLSSRIIQRRKQWLAETLGFSDASELRHLSPHWWFHLGGALCEVVMPPEFYQVGEPGNLKWNNLGLNAFGQDWNAWPNQPEADQMLQSQFELFRQVGLLLFRDPRQALDFAMEKIALRVPKPTLQAFAGWKAQKQLFQHFEGGMELTT